MGERFDWKFWATLLAAVAGVVVPVVIWQLDFSSKALTVRVVSSVAVLSEKSAPGLGVELTIDGRAVDRPYFSSIEVVNEGSKPIPSADFESALEISAGPKSHILRAKVDSAQPADLRPQVEIKEAVLITPLLLNPSDKFTLSILTVDESPNFSVRGRIAGIKQIRVQGESVTFPNYNKAILLGGIALCVLWLYFMFGAAAIAPGAIALTRPVAIGTMIVLSVISNELISRTFVLAGITPSMANILLAMLVFAVINAPFMIKRFANASEYPRFVRWLARLISKSFQTPKN